MKNNRAELSKLKEEVYRLTIEKQIFDRLLDPELLEKKLDMEYIKQHENEILSSLKQKEAILDTLNMDYIKQRQDAVLNYLRQKGHNGEQGALYVLNNWGLKLDEEARKYYDTLVSALDKKKAILEELNQLFQEEGSRIRTNYDAIKISLDHNIKLMKEKIAILDELRNSKKIASASEVKILNKYVVLIPAGVVLVLQAKSDTSLKKGKNYQPILINNKKDYTQIQDIIKENINKEQPFHYDIILQYGHGSRSIHYTPISIDFDGKNIKSFAHDAGGDVQNTNTIDALVPKEVPQLCYSYRGGIQMDGYSCPVFSIQDLRSMAKIGPKDLDKYIHGVGTEFGKVKEEQIADLHPRFLKNAQSRKAVKINLANEKNNNLIVSKGKNLLEYIENYTITVEVANEMTNMVEQKQQNRAIDYKTLKYLELARETLETIYKTGGEELLQEVIKQRTGEVLLKPRVVQNIIPTNELENKKSYVPDARARRSKSAPSSYQISR